MIVYDDDKLRFRMDIACDRCGRRLIQELVKNNPIAAKCLFPRVTSDGILCDFFRESVLLPILQGRGNGWRINPTKDAITYPDCPMVLKNCAPRMAQRGNE